MRSSLKPVIFRKWTPLQLGGALKLWIDPSDTGTLFQSNAASTAITADGQAVGYAGDKSPNQFHLTSAANDTTRPTYKTSAGLSWLSFDSSNVQLLRRLAAINLYNNGYGFSIFMALKGASISNTYFFGEASSVSNNPIVAPIRSSGTATTADMYFRNDSGGEYVPVGSLTVANAWAASPPTVYGVTDDGAGNLTAYLNGASAGSFSYTRQASTVDRTALGGLLRASALGHTTMDFYQVVVTHGVISEASRRKLVSFMGKKAGIVV